MSKKIEDMDLAQIERVVLGREHPSEQIDGYTRLAADHFGVSYDQVTRAQREVAKTLFFERIYRGGQP